MGRLSFFRKYNDEEIVRILRNEPDKEREILEYLYRKQGKFIINYLMSRGSDHGTAEDMFQESLIVFYEQIRAGRFVLKGSIAAYLQTLARNRWLNSKRKTGRMVTLTESNVLKGSKEESLEPISFSEKARHVAKELMNQLDRDCRKVLELSIYKNLLMEDIAIRMGYKNEQVARNKKHKCLDKLKLIIGKG